MAWNTVRKAQHQSWVDWCAAQGDQFNQHLPWHGYTRPCRVRWLRNRTSSKLRLPSGRRSSPRGELEFTLLQQAELKTPPSAPTVWAAIPFKFFLPAPGNGSRMNWAVRNVNR